MRHSKNTVCIAIYSLFVIWRHRLTCIKGNEAVDGYVLAVLNLLEWVSQWFAVILHHLLTRMKGSGAFDSDVWAVGTFLKWVSRGCPTEDGAGIS